MLLGFVISFVVVYLFYLFTVISQTKKYEKFKKSNQVMYFVKKYKIDVNKLNMKKFTNILAVTNSLIISIAFTATYLVDSFMLQLLIGLIVLIPLIFIFYCLIGNYLKRKCK